MNKVLLVLSLIFLYACSNSSSIATEDSPYRVDNDFEVVRLIASKYDMPVSRIRMIVENYYECNDTVELESVYLPEELISKVVVDYKVLCESLGLPQREQSI